MDEFGLVRVLLPVPQGDVGQLLTNDVRVDREFGVFVESFVQGCDRDPQRTLVLPEVSDCGRVFGFAECDLGEETGRSQCG